MTTKLMFLDRNLNSLRASWSCSQIITINLWLLISLGGFFPLFLSTPTLAESSPTVTEQLPPPPPISPRSRRTRTRRYNARPKTDLEPPIHSREQREYTFSAPATNFPSSNISQSYRVEVFGTSEALLNQVRAIEPKAFRKGGVIQAGIFQDQTNAEELVRRLARQGLWSRIMSNY